MRGKHDNTVATVCQHEWRMGSDGVSAALWFPETVFVVVFLAFCQEPFIFKPYTSLIYWSHLQTMLLPGQVELPEPVELCLVWCST